MPAFNLPPGATMRDIDPGTRSDDCARCGGEFYEYDVDEEFPNLCPECVAFEKERLAAEDDVVAREGIPQTGVTVPAIKDKTMQATMLNHRIDSKVGMTGESITNQARRLVNSVLERFRK
jgi:hypothetical protein